MKADLHIHSTCSDGTDTPEEILHLAKEKEFFGLSITDHDTIDAYSPEFFSLAKKLNLSILPGVELSSQLKEDNVHILAYGFDLKDTSFIEFIKEIQTKRVDRNLRMIKKFHDLGIEIDPSFLEKNPITGRPHFAQILIEKNIVKDFREAFDLYLRDGEKGYVPWIKPTPIKVIEAIHKAGGVALIAHPHIIKKRVLKKLLDLPFDGLECYYAKFNSAQERPYLQIAKKKKWLFSGGSDYHGHIKPRNSFGCSWVNENIFNLLNRCQT